MAIASLIITAIADQTSQNINPESAALQHFQDLYLFCFKLKAL
jgi:cytochrome c oxidase assembly protein Cox11